MWKQHDIDGNGMLDRGEAKTFLGDLVQIISSERAQNYKEENFEALFTKFDEDKNGFLEKAEMAVFIKKVFRKPKEG